MAQNSIMGFTLHLHFHLVKRFSDDRVTSCYQKNRYEGKSVTGDCPLCNVPVSLSACLQTILKSRDFGTDLVVFRADQIHKYSENLFLANSLMKKMSKSILCKKQSRAMQKNSRIVNNDIFIISTYCAPDTVLRFFLLFNFHNCLRQMAVIHKLKIRKQTHRI